MRANPAIQQGIYNDRHVANLGSCVLALWLHTQFAFFFFFIMQFRNLTHCFYLSESDSLFFYKHHRFRCRSGSEPAGPEGFNSANSQLTKYIKEKFSFLFSFMDPCLIICFEFTCLGCRYPPGIKAALLLWQHSMLIS